MNFRELWKKWWISFRSGSKIGPIRMNSCAMDLSWIIGPRPVHSCCCSKDKAIELRDKLDNFRDRFMVDLAIEMRVKQGLLFVPDADCSTCLIQVSDAIADDVKSMHAGVVNLRGELSVIPVKHLLNRKFIPGSGKASPEQKELDDLVRVLRGNGLPLHDPCMEGARLDIISKMGSRASTTTMWSG